MCVTFLYCYVEFRRTVETYIVPSTAPPTGIGEPGTPVIGPAVANALLAITGRPTLSQPFVKV